MVFSIGVAIYNAENTLRSCLSSIKAQSFFDYEVILVDDGSTDSSATIALEFALSDKRFKYFGQTNHGSNYTYNRIIDIASGTYFLNLDDDDELSPNALDALNRIIAEYDPDIVELSLTETRDDDGTQQSKTYRDGLLNGKKNILDAVSSHRLNDRTHSGKAIRRRLFDSMPAIRFSGHPVGADTLVCKKLIALSERYAFSRDAVWVYHIRPDSQSHRPDGSLSESAQYFGRYWVDIINSIPFFEHNIPKTFLSPLGLLSDEAWHCFHSYLLVSERLRAFDFAQIKKMAGQYLQHSDLLLKSRAKRFVIRCISFMPFLAPLASRMMRVFALCKRNRI